MNAKQIDDEVMAAIDTGLEMMPGMSTWGWTGFPIYTYTLYSWHYFQRMQSLTLCGFENNLEMNVDAEWYLAVMQPTLDKVRDLFDAPVCKANMIPPRVAMIVAGLIPVLGWLMNLLYTIYAWLTAIEY